MLYITNVLTPKLVSNIFGCDNGSELIVNEYTLEEAKKLLSSRGMFSSLVVNEDDAKLLSEKLDTEVDHICEEVYESYVPKNNWGVLIYFKINNSEVISTIVFEVV